MKLTIKNLQSIAEASLEFNEGVTIITGPNGSGKSASFRAMRALLTNPNGCAGYVKHDEKYAEVTLENNDESVTWRRYPDTTTYINNKTGQEFIKASKMDSRDVADLGFYFNNKDELVNVPSEWETLFPFGESDTEMFRLFEDIFNVSNSFMVIDSYKSEENDIKRNLGNLSSQKDSLKFKIERVEHTLNNIDKSRLIGYQTKISSQNQEIVNLESDLSIFQENYLNSILKVPVEVDKKMLIHLDNLVMQLREIESDLTELQENRSILDINFVDYPLSKFDSLKTLDLTEINTMEKDLVDYNRFSSEYDYNQQEIIKYDKLINESKEKLAEIKVCRTCGKEFLNEFRS